MRKFLVLRNLVILLLSAYFLLRLLFFISNYNSFNFNNVADCTAAFFYGLRFDLSAIAFTNGLFFLLYILPLRIFYTKLWQSLLKTIFFITNIPALLINCVDAGYFTFTQKRTTSDFFGVITLGDDFKNMLPGIISDYWFLALVFGTMVWAFVYGYNRITYQLAASNTKKINAWQWSFVPLMAGLIVLTARGGTQYKPLSVLSAAKYTSTQNVSVVLNSTFTLIRTLGKEELTEIKLPGIKNSSAYFNPIHNYSAGIGAMNKKNIVVIVMESFSKEYVGAFNNGKGYTPFLDSLILKSYVCLNAYANGKKSIEGIPAVVSGIAALMNGSYIGSTYNGNKINSLPLLLKKYGYSSAFYHGGNNGTMGFDNFSRMAGFDRYVGRNEYNGDDYDGTWGIFDEPFFKFFCNEMNKMPKPFVTTFFSLSSHHPYKIPAQMQGAFESNLTPVTKGIRYADYSLQKFFECASTQNWYSNTLFVITADHTGPVLKSEYKNRTGIYSIPILFFDPDSNINKQHTGIAQQTDIVPSVLDYINYPEPFKFFGNSVFDSTAKGYNINYLAGTYQLIANNYVVNFDGEKLTGFYKLTDTDFKNNLAQLPSATKDSLYLKIKLMVADYNASMIYNRLTQQ